MSNSRFLGIAFLKAGLMVSFLYLWNDWFFVWLC